MDKTVINGRYELLRRLGAGGMGEVWLAKDRSNGEKCAVKLLNPHAVADASIRLRFTREAEILSQLRHPNLVAVRDSGMEGERPFLAMDYVEGSDLAALVDERGPLSPQEAIRLVQQMLEGLGCAHAHKIVHRDVKPHNVLIGVDGELRIGDFGIARFLEDDSPTFTRSGAFLGSPSYMAPEQRADARHAGVQADIYGAGVTFYFLLTGRSGAQLHVREVQEEVARSLPAAVAEVILHATRYRPTDRYSSARVMSMALDVATDRLRRGADTPMPYLKADFETRTISPWTGADLGPVPRSPRASPKVVKQSPDADANTPPDAERRWLGWGALAGVGLGAVVALVLVLTDRLPASSQPAEASPGEPPPALAAPVAPEQPVVATGNPPVKGGKGEYGTLLVEARPAATIVLDEVYRGPGPAEFHLPVGNHSAVLTGPDGRKVTLSVRILAGQTQRTCWDFEADGPCAGLNYGQPAAN